MNLCMTNNLQMPESYFRFHFNLIHIFLWYDSPRLQKWLTNKKHFIQEYLQRFSKECAKVGLIGYDLLCGNAQKENKAA